MSTKKFKVSFFRGYINADDTDVTLKDVFSGLAKSKQIVWLKHKKTVFQIREVHKSGHSYKGIFAKFRSDTLPHIGTQNGRSERPIEMTEGEGLLEKNFFLFDDRFNLLTLQTNGHACNSRQIAELVSEAAKKQVSFCPILRKDSIKRLLKDDIKPYKFQLAFAKPESMDLLDSDDFSGPMMTLLSSVGGCSCDVTISASPSGRSKVKGLLNDSFKKTMAYFSDNITNTKSAKIWFDGESEPIDLIADRIQGKTETVLMEGKYPEANAMYAALATCKDLHMNEICTVLDAKNEKNIQGHNIQLI